MLQVSQDLRSGAVEVAEVPDPVVGPGQVLVANSRSLLSAGTESAISRLAARGPIGKARERPADAKRVIDKLSSDGLRATRDALRARLDDPLTPGYSSMGVVVEVGSGGSALKEGARVACVGADHACHAELALMPQPLCIPLPREVGDSAGAFGALGAIAAHSVRLAEVEAGGVVAVIGLGLVGQLVSQLASAAGARVVAIDPIAERLALAEAAGARASAAPDSGEALARVLGLSGGAGADTVIIAAAASDNAPIELAAELARDRATVCAVGDIGLELPRARFYEKELQLRISRSYGPGRYDAKYEVGGVDYPIGYVRWTQRRLLSYFFDEVAAGSIDLASLITHEFPVERASEAYEALKQPDRLAILLTYPTEGRTRETRLTINKAANGRRRVQRPRVALIGAGTYARTMLLPRLNKLDLDLAAIVGRSGPRAVAAAKRFGAAEASSDAAAVLADPSIDAVVIATRHDSHAALAVDALRSGKAVFVEKPLAIDASGLGEIERSLEAGGELVVGFNRSVAPSTARIVKHFSGRGSEPLYVQCRVNAGALEAGHWLDDPLEGGGRLVGEACHFVDLASTIVGSPLRTVQVAGMGLDAGKDESFALQLQYENGSAANIAYIASGSPAMRKERIEVIGAGQAAVIDDFRKLELYGRRRHRASRRVTLGASRPDKGHTALVGAAVKCFRGEAEGPIPVARAIETTHATLLARAALASGDLGPLSLP